MITQGRPIRRLSRRARILLILFVLPVLMFSASTRSENEAIRITSQSSDKVITMTYAVHDLLRPARRASGEIREIDFASLIDRIKQEAAPGTWGDPGEIVPLANNLSLVISHNALGHDAVAAFLSELRKSALGVPQ